MRVSVLQLGILVALAGLASGAQAATPASSVARAPVIAVCIDGRVSDAGGSARWINETLLKGLDGRVVSDAGGTADLADADHQRTAKPHQNPAFPAAFVFQSNSALYLAIAVPNRDERNSPSGS